MRFLFENKKMSVQQSSYIWNMTAGMIFGFQSVFLLMVITRALGLYEAGLFTIAYANANLFLTIGKYGMKNYQATDVKNQFSFGEYLTSRYLSSAAMIVVSAGYILYTGHTLDYTKEKMLIIFFMCLLKVVDAMEDVYLGWYQLKGRLDVGGKIMTLRLISTMLVWIAGMIILKSLLYSLIVACVFSVIVLIFFVKETYPQFKEDNKKESVQFGKVWKLLGICFPLFLGTFLAFYIGNATKYAIDAQLTYEVQACYGFISMPVFIIGLLNGFIYQPILTQLAVLWKEKKVAVFVKKVLLECVVVAGITAAALIGGYLLGIPVLSILYHTDLTDYKAELLILLVGGGFLALSGFLLVALTIIRMQTISVVGYLITAVLAYILSPVMVRKSGVMGASVLYTLLMLLLAVLFAIMMAYKLISAIKEKD